MCLNFNTEGINLYFLCPFFCFFFLVISTYSSSGFESEFAKYPFTQNIIVSFGEILAIIPYLISVKIDKITYKKKKINILNSEGKASTSIQYEYNKSEDNIKQANFTQILLLGFVDFIQSSCFFYGNYFNNYQLYNWGSQILFLCIFSKYLLKTKLYIHHLFSFIIFFIFDLIDIIVVLFDDKLKYKSIQILFIVISSFCFSFELIYEKKLFENYFLSIYKLCFMVGLSTLMFNLIAAIIVTIISNYINNDDIDLLFNYINYFKIISEDLDKFVKEILLILLYMFFMSLYNIFQFLTIKSLSPNHPLITQVLLAFYISILNILYYNDLNTITKITPVVINSISILILLIFLEIIEINCCGLDQETKHNIRNRSDLDKYFQKFGPNNVDGENDDDSDSEKEEETK